ncbi:hypothetical protein BDV93DRAFT_609233 [Ceratobasidium sp. AG-I]|nr:hypothetical protein BDV93DRAFT_609233 [Ceratobasidium sp. AG-I]
MTVDATTLCIQWTAARKQLSETLCSYEAACNSLCIPGSQTGTAIESAQPDFLLSLEADLPLLPQEAERIIRPLGALKKLRNYSNKLVPINRLPSELLVSIFAITLRAGRAARPRGADGRGPLGLLNAISSVSSRWRQVILATPMLWANIALNTAGGVNHATLWFERSLPAPIHLRSLCYYYGEDEKNMAELTQRHIGRFESLVLRLDNGFGQTLLHDACVQFTEASVKLESLAITGDPCTYNNDPTKVNWPPKDQMDKYMASVRTLYLEFRPFDDWTSTAFHNLTSLNLCWIGRHVAPTHRELRDVLRASPRLRHLRLSMFTVAAIPKRQTTPVKLEQLEVLWLESLPFQFVEWFLGSIVPQRDGLILTLNGVAYVNHQSIGFRLPFVIPDRVGTLYIRSSSLITFPVDLSGLLGSSPRLETLALQGIKLDIIEPTVSSRDIQHPALTVLDLKSCHITHAAMFKAMLARHSVRQLRAFECKGCPSADELVEKLPEIIVSEVPGEFLTMSSPFE